MRILFAGTTFVLGGAERVVSHLLLGLRARGHDVELLALRGLGPVGEEIGRAGVVTHASFTGEGRVDPRLFWRLIRFLRHGRYEAIYFLDHAHAVFYVTLASLGSSVRVRVMPVHTTGQWGGARSLKRPILAVRQRLDRIIAIAEAQREYLVAEEGIPRRQIEVIPNGIPLGESFDRERVRAELGAHGPVIGITAVLRPEKNHELLLNAFALVRERVPAELWVVGDGPRRVELEELARRLEVEAHVRFFGQRSDSRRVMQAFDVAVLSSHPLVETLPLALLEAMDAGVPVVATRVGALAEMVEEGRSGLLVEPGDPRKLAEAIVATLSDRSRAEAMGRRGREIVRERFSVERMVASTERLLEHLAARS